MIVSCLGNSHHILSTVKRFLLPCAVFLRMQLSCKQNICLNSNFKASIFFQEVYHIDSVGFTPTRNRWFLLDNTYCKHLLNWDTAMLILETGCSGASPVGFSTTFSVGFVQGKWKQWLRKIIGVNKMHYCLCENGEYKKYTKKQRTKYNDNLPKYCFHNYKW